MMAGRRWSRQVLYLKDVPMPTAPLLRPRYKAIHWPGSLQLWVSLSPNGTSSLEDQAESIYESFAGFLSDHHLDFSNVVTERFHCGSVADAAAVLDRVRYRISSRPPPIMLLQQPPANPSHHLVFQAHLVQATDLERLESLPGGVDGVSYDVGGAHYVHLAGLTGARPDHEDTFEREAGLMFERAQAALVCSGLDFRNVVRTWIYLPDLERDYATFNRVRTAFFEDAGVRRIPASTGIQGTVFPANIGPGMDLLAIVSDSRTKIQVLRASTMNEAPVYGSAFSRGMSVSVDGNRLAYLSGTASIDEQGEVFGAGDIDLQLGRMLRNVSALLEPLDACLDDAVCATVYLKDPSYLPAFERLRVVPSSVPLSIVIADVCRPGWLCEMEAIVAA